MPLRVLQEVGNFVREAHAQYWGDDLARDCWRSKSFRNGVLWRWSSPYFVQSEMLKGPELRCPADAPHEQRGVAYGCPGRVTETQRHDRCCPGRQVGSLGKDCDKTASDRSKTKCL